jgi:beta-N-acetylhexosaminidase
MGKPLRTVATYVLAVAPLVLAALLLAIAIDWRSPLLAEWRTPALAVLLIAPAVLIAFEFRTRRTPQPWPIRGLRLGTVLLAAVTIATTLVFEVRFQWTRWSVLRAEPDRMERLGRHLIVGYRHPSEIDHLLGLRAIAGVFITARNVKGLSAEDIARQVATWQSIRRDQGLPPLLIATDQEGGPVSRLSPPLPRQSPLATIAGDRSEPDPVHAYGLAQGRALASVGVNLNFAPVVDLNYSVVDPGDRYTRVYLRAISSDPNIVSDVAARYCRALAEAGVRCTLKHFPGLGSVVGDTHLQTAELTTPIAELERSDWVPFRTLMNEVGSVMLGHARLGALDSRHPASFSQAVVGDMLRTQWRYDGLLITDDFCMGAVYASADGLAAAAVNAVNAGVDLILVSYDPSQYFAVMEALLRADRDGHISAKALESSEQRLGRALRSVGRPTRPTQNN